MLNVANEQFFNGNFRGALDTILSVLNAQNAQDLPPAMKAELIDLGALCALKLRDSNALLLCAESYMQHKDSRYYALNLGRALNLAQDYKQAKEILSALVNDARNPLKLESLRELLETYKGEKDLEKCDEIYKIIVQNDPENTQNWVDYANFFYGNPNKCIDILNAHLQFLQGSIEQLSQIAPKIKVESQTPNSIQSTIDALEQKEQWVENPAIKERKDYINNTIYYNLALAYLRIFKNPKEEAKSALKLFESIKESPQAKNTAFWYHYGSVLEFLGKYDEAKSAYKSSISIDDNPNCKFKLAYLLMRLDEFKEGIPLYESRLKFVNSMVFAPKQYDEAMSAFKEDKNAFYGKDILVYCEQGFGDTFMFCRLLGELCKVARKVLFTPQSALFRLLNETLDKKSFKNLEVLDKIPASFDYALPLTTLPLVLGIESKEALISPKTPLILKRDKNERVKKRIGFFWHTQMALKEENTRNFSLEFFLKLIDEIRAQFGDKVEFVSLQVGDFDLPNHISNLARDFKDWLDTYKVMQDLDCVIGIDSSPAHLSMLCKIPTFIILQPRFDWRFGLYEKPKAKFYGKEARLFVTNPNDLAIKDDLIKQLKEVLEF